MTVSLFDLSGKRALVTGASGGLGQSFVRTLHAAGAEVIMTGRNPEHPTLTSLSKDCHGKSQVLALDVTQEADIIALFDTLRAQGTRLDVLVNNAGIASSTLALDTTLNAWDDVMATNLRGPWLLAQAFGAHCVAASKGGSLINVASILGSRVATATSTYATAKAGLKQMTRALALEWARHGIRVNSLSPGYIETNMTRPFFESSAGRDVVNRLPQRRIGQPDDLAGALLLLASDASGYMSGSDLVVDGGHLCSSL